MAKKSKEYDELLNSVEDLIKESEAASTRSREKELAFLKLLTEDTSATPRKGSNSAMTGPKTPKEKPTFKGFKWASPDYYKRVQPQGSVVILTGRGHNLKKSSGNPSTSKEGSEKK